MSHINNIHIKNFKSIRDAEIKDCKRINVFVGQPNVGKSNIQEALKLFSYSKETTSLSLKDLIRYDKLAGLFFDGNIEDKASVTIDEKGDTLVYVREAEIEYRNSDEVILKLSDGHSNTSKGHVLGFKLSESGVGKVDVYSGRNQKEYVYFNVRPYHFIGGDFSKSISARELVFPKGENLFEVLGTNKGLQVMAADLFKPYNLSLLFDTLENDFKVAKTLDHNIIFSIPFSQIADTLQRLLFYLVAININRESVLTLEEPESHMYPPYISKLTAEMIHDDRQNQFFLTTHSPFVLNDIMENLGKEEYAIYAVGYKNETGETVVRRITDAEIDEIYQYGIDLFFNLENYLENAVLRV
jgi:AAA15 family ATPase/GTPase